MNGFVGAVKKFTDRVTGDRDDTALKNETFISVTKDQNCYTVNNSSVSNIKGISIETIADNNESSIGLDISGGSKELFDSQNTSEPTRNTGAQYLSNKHIIEENIRNRKDTEIIPENSDDEDEMISAALSRALNLVDEVRGSTTPSS